MGDVSLKAGNYGLLTTDKTFEGIKIDVCMPIDQYRASCRKFHVSMMMRKDDRKTIRGPGGNQVAMGISVISVPLKKLKLIADVKFQIFEDKIHSLLCMKNMKQNGLDTAQGSKTGTVHAELFSHSQIETRWN